MTTRAQIVAEARSWIGTPFHHQGELKGVGADCGGLILGVGKLFGLLGYDVAPVYGRRPNGFELRSLCDEYLDRRPHDDLRAGNILLMPFREEPQHLALATGDGAVIHILAQAPARCCEHRLDNEWAGHVTAVYCFRGLSDG